MKASIIATALLAGLGFAAAAHAAPAPGGDDPQHVLNITGKIVGQTCQIDFGKSGHTVILKTVRTDQINAPANVGKAFQPTKFDIALQGCTNIEAGINTVALNFGLTSGSVADAQGNFTNHGDATGVAVRILEADAQTQIGAGKNSKSFTVKDDGTAVQSYNAAYFTQKGDATKGSVEAESVVNVSYL